MKNSSFLPPPKKKKTKQKNKNSSLSLPASESLEAVISNSLLFLLVLVLNNLILLFIDFLVSVLSVNLSPRIVGVFWKNSLTTSHIHMYCHSGHNVILVRAVFTVDSIMVMYSLFIAKSSYILWFSFFAQLFLFSLLSLFLVSFA